MKIRSKLIVGFLAILILMTSLAGLGINMLSKIHDNSNVIVNHDYKRVSLVTNIRYEVNNIAKSIRNLMLIENNINAEQEFESIDVSIGRAERHMQQLDTLLTNKNEVSMYITMRRNYNNYIKLIQNELEIVRQENKSEAVYLALNDGRQIQKDFFNSSDGLILYLEQVMDSEIAESGSLFDSTLKLMILLTGIGILLGIIITYWIIRDITQDINKVSAVMTKFAQGNLDASYRIDVTKDDELSEIATAFNAIAHALEEQSVREEQINRLNQEQAWLKTNIAEISTELQSISDFPTFTQTLITRITPLVGGSHGGFYLATGKKEKQYLKLSGTYAFKGSEKNVGHVNIGEGLVGQCAIDKKTILLTDVPTNYIKINSGLGESEPLNIIILPVIFERELMGIIEIGSFYEFSSIQKSLLDQLANQLGILINNLAGQVKTEELLTESQVMTEELQVQSEELLTQQEELKRTNEKLEAQTKSLIKSEEVLQEQQEELEQSHVELEEKAKLLEERNYEYEQKNIEVEKSKKELEEKANQLALTSKYKSEFLANMSHELRTPLNSLLILAKILADNKESNLTEQQTKFAKTVYSSGYDLLNLINEILDLSKVESGKMEIEPSVVEIISFKDFVESTFHPLAQQKNIDLKIVYSDNLPQYVLLDEQRVQQILKNLLSNAFKFTSQGDVTFSIKLVAKENIPSQVITSKESDCTLEFSVSDTGIGIPKDKQQIIFEAFQQADGSTSRKYGGTGLGLSISRQIAAILGGALSIYSIEGEGSTFSLYLPVTEAEQINKLNLNNMEMKYEDENPTIVNSENSTKSPYTKVEQLKEIAFENKTILIVDDDIRNVFALSSILESYNMKVVYAENGKESLEVLQNNPDIDLVLMDIMMPEMDGYEAMHCIRMMTEFQKLPIIALTAKAMKGDRKKCIDSGASDYIAKPVNADQLISLMRVWLHK